MNNDFLNLNNCIEKIDLSKIFKNSPSDVLYNGKVKFGDVCYYDRYGEVPHSLYSIYNVLIIFTTLPLNELYLDIFPDKIYVKESHFSNRLIIQCDDIHNAYSSEEKHFQFLVSSELLQFITEENLKKLITIADKCKERT